MKTKNRFLYNNVILAKVTPSPGEHEFNIYKNY